MYLTLQIVSNSRKKKQAGMKLSLICYVGDEIDITLTMVTEQNGHTALTKNKRWVEQIVL